jgi:small subunit ribosomal protein S1
MELQREELEKLYADTFKGIQTGSILKGKVVQVKSAGVIVDIGTKCEGFIPAIELPSEEYTMLKQGDDIEVFVTDIKTSDGFISLSRERVVRIKTWKMLENACDGGQTLEGKIVGKVKGGMTVEIAGVNAFLPGSHIDLKSCKDTDSLIGEVCPFKVLKVNNKRSNIIVSRRMILEEERGKMRKETLSRLKEGVLVSGMVKNLTDYGVFIDLGGIDGLLHISDMSWSKISHPGELFSIGDTVEVIVLHFDEESNKVTLGYKQKKPDPWTDAEHRYPTGKRIMGKVTNIVDYGIFIKLEEGLDGLVHISEFDWLEKIKKPSKYFSIGDTVEAVVLNVNKENKRISLSIKQLKPNPWESIKQKYIIGEKAIGRVKSLSDFGAFITLDEGIDALLHISEMSWTKHIKHPSEILKKGQKVEVVILNIDTEKERIAVGLRELEPDPWINEIPKKFKIGSEVKGKVAKVTDFGIFLELEGEVEGLIHASEIHKEKEEKLDEMYKIGDELTVNIKNVDSKERKIRLSMKTTDDEQP